MLRLDCLRAAYDRLDGCLVVTIMGAVACELQSLGHKQNFFYLQHAMGLGSSTGLGLALCLPQQKVVVFDGDGSILMNLGGYTTLARYRPKNLVHVVFDNESLLSVGGFPTATWRWESRRQRAGSHCQKQHAPDFWADSARALCIRQGSSGWSRRHQRPQLSVEEDTGQGP